MSFVSIIIPFKENVDYLFLALDSIFKQTYKKFNIIIIYDNEDKKDLKKINKFISKKDIKKKFSIRIILNKKNLGAGESRNKGIKISKARFVAFLDSDDTWHKNKLKFQINFMKKNKEIISHTSYNVINERGNKISSRKSKKTLTFNEIIKSCDVGLSTVMINLQFLKKHKLFFPKLKTKEDYVLWLKILKIIPNMKGLDKNLTNYRKRKNSLSSKNITNIINGYLVYRVYLKMNFMQSFYRLLILSLNFLRKKIKYDFNF